MRRSRSDSRRARARVAQRVIHPHQPGGGVLPQGGGAASVLHRFGGVGAGGVQVGACGGSRGGRVGAARGGRVSVARVRRALRLHGGQRALQGGQGGFVGGGRPLQALSLGAQGRGLDFDGFIDARVVGTRSVVEFRPARGRGARGALGGRLLCILQLGQLALQPGHRVGMLRHAGGGGRDGGRGLLCAARNAQRLFLCAQRGRVARFQRIPRRHHAALHLHAFLGQTGGFTGGIGGSGVGGGGGRLCVGQARARRGRRVLGRACGAVGVEQFQQGGRAFHFIQLGPGAHVLLRLLLLVAFLAALSRGRALLGERERGRLLGRRFGGFRGLVLGFQGATAGHMFKHVGQAGGGHGGDRLDVALEHQKVARAHEDPIRLQFGIVRFPGDGAAVELVVRGGGGGGGGGVDDAREADVGRPVSRAEQ